MFDLVIFDTLLNESRLQTVGTDNSDTGLLIRFDFTKSNKIADRLVQFGKHLDDGVCFLLGAEGYLRALE